MLKVILAKSFESAIEVADSGEKWVAIETEYGDKLLDTNHPNVIAACNHHGILQLNEAPAIQCQKLEQNRYDNFIISHIDLDVLFGILWAAGWLKKTKTTLALSQLVATADIDGFHVIHEKLKDYDETIIQKYFAIGYLANSWIFNDDGLLIKDLSKEVHKLLLKIKDIIIEGATKEQIILYEQWFEEQRKVVKKHLQQIIELCDDITLLVYRAPFSLSTAYFIEDISGDVIVQFNEQSKTLTLACFNDDIAEKLFGKNGVIEPLQKFFGDKAGGKKAIGGSPRSQKLQPEILQAFLEFLNREYFNVPEINYLEN